jgi:transposase
VVTRQFDEAESLEIAELPQEENTITVTYTRNKPVRRPLPAHLPREVIEHDVAEEDKRCACGCMKQRIGEEVTEQLEVIPAKLSVIAHIRPKYACNRCDEAVAIAPMPSSVNTKTICLYTVRSKYGVG